MICKNCGKELVANAKFCISCGTPAPTPLTNENESEKRKQVFVGVIRKCPNCGQQIASDTVKCPSCGFLIEKGHAAMSLDDFVKTFLSIGDANKKREFIESYVVPNNKEDIRGFLNYAESQRDREYENDKARAFWVDAWNNKCRQIVNQAVDFFGVDRDFVNYLNDYKAGIEKKAKKNEKLKKKLEAAAKRERFASNGGKFFSALKDMYIKLYKYALVAAVLLWVVMMPMMCKLL
ncbi:MAG: zinc ribbon domain-containing protein [Treponema sp.]|nr:zinc ribbon domain-containing protein [Treponema sp.]MEE3434522.1 zinc ribbon domain-containing protein [Treponema sp.]